MDHCYFVSYNVVQRGWMGSLAASYYTTVESHGYCIAGNHFHHSVFPSGNPNPIKNPSFYGTVTNYFKVSGIKHHHFIRLMNFVGQRFGKNTIAMVCEALPKDSD